MDHLECPKKSLCTVDWSSRGAKGWHLSINRIWNGFPMAWKHYLLFFKTLKVPFSCLWQHHFQLQERYRFCAFANIASNCKKDSFLRLSWDRLKLKKRYLFRGALKHRLVKWKIDEERTILTSKYHSLESWKYLTSFSKKVPFLNF